MSYFCKKCGDKLEDFHAVETIEYSSYQRIEWTAKTLMYCDNQDCSMVGIVKAMAITKRPKRSAATPTTSPDKEQKEKQ